MALRELIFNNFWLKLFSLVMATLIWFAVAIQPDTRVGQNANNVRELKFQNHPITVMKSASDARGFRVSPSQVDVTVVGRPEQLQTLKSREIEVFINLTDVYDTDGLVKPVQVYAPAGITVIKVEPDSVRIERVRNE